MGGLQHLTLDEIVDVVKRVAARFAPFFVCYGSADHGTAFFRCVYLKFRQLSAALLTELHNAVLSEAHKGVDCRWSPNVGGYMPHVSLVYGHFPEETKKEIIGNNQQYQWLCDSWFLNMLRSLFGMSQKCCGRSTTLEVSSLMGDPVLAVSSGLGTVNRLRWSHWAVTTFHS